jgi:hypothetical protein
MPEQIVREPEELGRFAVVRLLLHCQLQMCDCLLKVALLVIDLAQPGFEAGRLRIFLGELTKHRKRLVELALADELVGTREVRGGDAGSRGL